MVQRAVITEVEPVWCLVADVAEQPPYGPGRTDWQGGLPLFAPGTRVHVVDGYAGLGYQTVTVVGSTGPRPGYATVAVATEHLTNWRVKLVSSPDVLEQLDAVSPPPGSGLSAHSADRGGDAYREDLRRLATTFRRRTGAIHRHWYGGRPPVPGGESDAAGRFAGRGLARLRRLISAGRPRGRSRY